MDSSLIFTGQQAGNIDLAGDVDKFSLTLDPGQKLSVLVTSDASLRSKLTLADAKGKALSSATATQVGKDTWLQTYSVPGYLADGNSQPLSYSLSVAGADKTMGSYQLQVMLNVALEAETVGAANNDSLATAQTVGWFFHFD